MTPKTRRRGRALDEALLDATWTVLQRVGYSALTTEAIAQQAATSKSVLYRRWPTLPEVVLAAVLHRAPPSAISAPDTGSLRGDLQALFAQMSDRLADADIAVPGLIADFRGNPQLLARVRTAVFGTATDIVQTIVHRAADRGEIPTAQLPDRTLTAPLDLARYELLSTAQRLDETTIDALVDQVALPLLGARSTTTSPTAPG